MAKPRPPKYTQYGERNEWEPRIDQRGIEFKWPLTDEQAETRANESEPPAEDDDEDKDEPKRRKFLGIF